MISKFIISLLIVASFVYATNFTPQGNIDLKSWYSLVNGLDVNVSNINVVNLSASNMDINLSWTSLKDYPVACPSGTYLTQLNDSVTCTAVTQSDIEDGVTIPATNVTGGLDANGVKIPQSNISSGITLPVANVTNALDKTGDTMTGDLTINKTNPNLYLTDTYSSRLNTESSGTVLQINPGTNGTDNPSIRMFQYVNTTGIPAFWIYKGDGTTTPTFGIYANTGNIVTMGSFNTGSPITFNNGLTSYGGLVLESGTPSLILKSTSDTGGVIQFYNSTGTQLAQFYFSITNDDWAFKDVLNGIERLKINRTNGDITKMGSFNTGSPITFNNGITSSGDITLSNSNIVLEGNAQRIYTTYSGSNGFLYLDPIATDGTSGAVIRLFRYTNTTGTRGFTIYKGDGTGTSSFNIDASSGNIDIMAGAFSTGSPITFNDGLTSNGDISINKYGPKIYFNDSYPATISFEGDGIHMFLNPGTNGTDNPTIRMFRYTNTTGSPGMWIYKGDGTSTATFGIYANTGNIVKMGSFNTGSQIQFDNGLTSNGGITITPSSATEASKIIQNYDSYGIDLLHTSVYAGIHYEQKKLLNIHQGGIHILNTFVPQHNDDTALLYVYSGQADSGQANLVKIFNGNTSSTNNLTYIYNKGTGEALNIQQNGNSNTAVSIVVGATTAHIKLNPISGPPNPAEEGMIYASTDHHLYYYNSTDWVVMA